jgi:hypothetical protein
LLKKRIAVKRKKLPNLLFQKFIIMATYGDLKPDFYYVVQELENSALELVYVPLITEKCVLVEFQDDEQTLAWNRKTDELFDIVEQLTEEQAVIYESLFDDEDDDDDDDFFWVDDDDDDDLWEDDDEDEEKEKIADPGKN